MSDDVVFLAGLQPPMSKEAFVAALQTMLAHVRIEFDSEIKEIRLFDDWAYCWSLLSVSVTPRSAGKPMRRKGHALSIFREKPGAARVLTRDAILLAAEASVSA